MRREPTRMESLMQQLTRGREEEPPTRSVNDVSDDEGPSGRDADLYETGQLDLRASTIRDLPPDRRRRLAGKKIRLLLVIKDGLKRKNCSK
jgi:hypothetical protein